MTKRRLFNRRERMALYIAADGKCQECGKPLEQGFHADHVQPFSKGGETDVINGQALCSDCNFKKGSNVSAVRKNTPHHPFWSIDLRKWQVEAFRKFQVAMTEKKDFLIVATPGAGKTLAAMRIAHDLLMSGRIEFIVVVCPTAHLKNQWAESAYRGGALGIHIRPDWTNASGDPGPDYHGVAVTYQQVAANPDIIRWMTGRWPTLVIFDEIHHAGDDKSWGTAIQHAFEHSKFRLQLSGTPFRSDNSRIPFVRYTEDGRSDPDHTYGYADALMHDVCRPVFFPSFEGRMEWLSSDGDIIEAAFRDELGEQRARERLKTALNPTGEWMNEVLRDANDRLQVIRANGHPNAAGLVIAIDQDHARAIAKLLQRISGVNPVVAVSDDPDASQKIDRFCKSDSAWIVAVKMVSEGVDIPRLRVGVYATNVTTELFFRQAVGRFVRVVDGIDEQSAYFYIPRENILITHAQTIKEERDHVLEMNIEKEEKKERGQVDPTNFTPSMFMPIDAEAKPDDVIFDASVFTQIELAEAKELARQMGLNMMNIQTEVVAKIMRVMKERTAPASEQPAATKPKYQEKISLKKQVNGLAVKYANIRGMEIRDVHTLWMKQGGSPQGQASEDELREKQAWLVKLIKDHKNGQH
jgi:superfamily II DNA or RNA helicase